LAETIFINKGQSLDEQYQSLVKQIKALLNKDDKLISNISNFVAALKQSFEKISWAGFYFVEGDNLYLGPFQGKVACTNIKIGQGVCGTAALGKKTVIVEDVYKFPGHIFCDADSRSEIVIPLIKNNDLFGVLDLDSTQISAFNYIDKKYLEEMCIFLSENIL
jgi:L-methionine (R)-S-oxide reductase